MPSNNRKHLHEMREHTSKHVIESGNLANSMVRARIDTHTAYAYSYRARGIGIKF